MPISGLVVSLSDQADLRQQAIESLQQEPRIEIGITASNRMAVAVDTASSAEDRQLWAWLTNLPGVVFVDVAMVAFEEEAVEATASGNHQDPSP